MQLVRMVILAHHMPIFMRFDTPEVIREWPKFGFRSRIQFHAVGYAARVKTRHLMTILGKPEQPIIGRTRNGVPVEGRRTTFIGRIQPVNRRCSLQLVAIHTRADRGWFATLIITTCTRFRRWLNRRTCCKGSRRRIDERHSRQITDELHQSGGYPTLTTIGQLNLEPIVMRPADAQYLDRFPRLE